MKSKLTYIIAAAVAVVVLAAGGIYWYTSGNYVAKVAGEKVTKAEFNFFLAQAKGEMEGSASLEDENAKKAFWESKIDGKNAKDVAKENALKYAKDYKINLIKAKEAKTVLSKEDNDKINSAVDQMVNNQGGRVKAEESLKAEYNMTLSEYKAFYKDYFLISKYRSEAVKNVQANDEELKKYYNEAMETGETTTVRHILISTKDDAKQDLTADKQEEARKKAEDILARVKAGEDFGTLVKENSQDPGSKDNVGQYTFAKGQMVKEFEEWSFKAKPGDIGMVKTDFGYHIMKKPTYDEITKDSYESLKSGAQQYKFSKDMDSLKDDPQYDAVINERVFDAIIV